MWIYLSPNLAPAMMYTLSGVFDSIYLFPISIPRLRLIYLRKKYKKYNTSDMKPPGKSKGGGVIETRGDVLILVYGRTILMPSFTSDWGTQIARPTRTIQWNLSWIFGRNRIKTITVGNVTINGNIFSISPSVNCMIGREAQVVLANLSQLMAAKMEELILYMRS